MCYVLCINKGDTQLTFQGHTVFTVSTGGFQVAVLGSDGAVYVTDKTRYASEATATLAAKAFHQQKPFMNFIVVRG
jgi:hypothetical protein